MTDDLKERLRKGIVSDSLHEDNETELFDVDAADELCEDALERIEQLEAALRDCVNVLACFERPDFYQLERTSPIKPYALGALDVARKALEGKDD